MTEEAKKPDGLWARLVSEFVAFIPKDMREMVGLQVGIYLFILSMVILFGASALIKLFQEPKAPDVPCWHIQTVESRVYKFNWCTGQTLELAPAPKVSPKPTGKE